MKPPRLNVSVTILKVSGFVKQVHVQAQCQHRVKTLLRASLPYWSFNRPTLSRQTSQTLNDLGVNEPVRRKR